MTARRRTAAALVAAATLSLGIISTGSASAINSVSCNGRSDFFEVHTDSYLYCYASNGSVSVWDSATWAVTSGNNHAVYNWFDSNGTNYQYVQPAWTDQYPSGTVTWIDITGR